MAERRFGVVVAALIVMFSVSACSSSRPANPRKAVDHKLVVTYEEAKTKATKQAMGLLKEQQLLEGLAQAVNDGYRLPRNVPLIAEDCGEENAFWDPEKKTITMCYEMVDLFVRLFAEVKAQDVDQAATGAIVSVFYHELGHGLIDLFDLPTTGKEEDAVDQLAVLILLGDSDKERGAADALSAADGWSLLASSEEVDDSAFADAHSLSKQRSYNILCYIYGSDAKAYKSLVKDGELPKERAEGCAAEYEQIEKAWSTLLEPHMKN